MPRAAFVAFRAGLPDGVSVMTATWMRAFQELGYDGFDLDSRTGDRAGTRGRLGVEEGEILLLHPVRAIERKNVPAALALAEGCGATYWLPGPAEEGYGPALDEIVARARTRVRRDP